MFFMNTIIGYVDTYLKQKTISYQVTFYSQAEKRVIHSLLYLGHQEIGGESMKKTLIYFRKQLGRRRFLKAQ